MPSLQIRDLPEHLYNVLAERARKNRRSLAQQATIELERLTQAEARNKRLEAVARLRQAYDTSGFNDTTVDPVEVVREDRDR
ncbi:MAG: hypothetical protein K8R59_00600 [Thermoanaerobaculales bacterium]|nr:hypothetical protein [Thermoanaerobaculales bacterium]